MNCEQWALKLEDIRNQYMEGAITAVEYFTAVVNLSYQVTDLEK